jgi:hypothetical protein
LASTVTVREHGGRIWAESAPVEVAQVVRSKDAIDAALCSATRTTFLGSMTPASTRFSYRSVCAFTMPSSIAALVACIASSPGARRAFVLQTDLSPRHDMA